MSDIKKHFGKTSTFPSTNSLPVDGLEVTEYSNGNIPREVMEELFPVIRDWQARQSHSQSN